MAPLLAAIIISNTNSYSSTGGNVVSSGGTITQGSSGSSSYVESVVNSSDSGGSATVHIETDTDGQVSDQTITKAIPPGGDVEIDVATSSASVRAVSLVNAGSSSSSLTSLQHAIHHLLEVASSSTTTALSIEATATAPDFTEVSFGAQVTAFFKRIFSIFGL
jgi:hypothetical protein